MQSRKARRAIGRKGYWRKRYKLMLQRSAYWNEEFWDTEDYDRAVRAQILRCRYNRKAMYYMRKINEQ